MKRKQKTDINMGEKKTKFSIADLVNRIWKALINLGPDQSVSTLSEKEREYFYAYLGYRPLPILLLVFILICFYNTTLGAGRLNVFLPIVFGIALFVFLLKLAWPKHEVIAKVTQREAIGCSFRYDKKVGTLSYSGFKYPVEHYSFLNGELFDMWVDIFEKDSSGEKMKITVFYDCCKKIFIERTEIKRLGGLSKSYKVISWVNFWTIIACSLCLIVGAIF